MSSICIIQARMSSTRLPGKVLAELNNQPLLQFMLRRVLRTTVDNTVVATTTNPNDDAIEQVARNMSVEVVRGPETDVLGRFAMVLEKFRADTVVRLTADCPLTDPDVINDALTLFNRTGADCVSNALVRTFPKGLDVEVMRASSLLSSAEKASDEVEREHVTPFLYRHPGTFELRNLRNETSLGDERWVVDTPEDLKFVQRIVETLGTDDFRWTDIVERVGITRQSNPSSIHLRPAYPADKDRILAWRNDPITVQFSKSRKEVDEDQHARWFAKALECPATRIWIGEIRSNPIGQIRIDVDAGVGLVGVTVDPLERGKGYGKALVGGLLDRLREDFQVIELIAEIHSDNEASIRAFSGNAFELSHREENFLTYRWIRY